jgi:hypothetical protein
MSRNELSAMRNSVDLFATPSAARTEDHSICLEAYGLLNHSYDSIDSLVRDLAHSGSQQVAYHANPVTEVTVLGQPEGLLPFSHLFL